MHAFLEFLRRTLRCDETRRMFLSLFPSPAPREAAGQGRRVRTVWLAPAFPGVPRCARREGPAPGTRVLTCRGGGTWDWRGRAGFRLPAASGGQGTNVRPGCERPPPHLLLSRAETQNFPAGSSAATDGLVFVIGKVKRRVSVTSGPGTGRGALGDAPACVRGGGGSGPDRDRAEAAGSDGVLPSVWKFTNTQASWLRK